MIAGRKQCETLFKFMKRFLPGFEHSYIMDTGSLLGIRESRRVKGDYILNQNDIENAVKHEDGIVSNHGGLEIHSVTENGTDIRELAEGVYYTVPYRCIIAKGLKNLFITGRCFSASHEALSAARNICYCIALGSAAATASSLLVKNNKTDVRDVDTDELRQLLANQI